MKGGRNESSFRNRQPIPYVAPTTTKTHRHTKRTNQPTPSRKKKKKNNTHKGANLVLGVGWRGVGEANNKGIAESGNPSTSQRRANKVSDRRTRHRCVEKEHRVGPQQANPNRGRHRLTKRGKVEIIKPVQHGRQQSQPAAALPDHNWLW